MPAQIKSRTAPQRHKQAAFHRKVYMQIAPGS